MELIVKIAFLTWLMVLSFIVFHLMGFIEKLYRRLRKLEDDITKPPAH